MFFFVDRGNFREGIPMPIWLQEAIASVSILIFFASAAVIAAGDPAWLPELSPFQVAELAR
jgi:hypothetical protein